MGKNKKNTAYIKQKSNQTPLSFLKSSNIIDLDLKKNEDNNLVIKSIGSEKIRNEENLQILSNKIDKYFLDKEFGTLSESDNKNLERIFREARKLNAMPHNIITDEENAILPVIKPFFEDKQIPSEREFKEEAKKLKVSGNFSSLGAAQNELARRYGFKEYRAIKSRFSKSLESYNNIKTITIHAYKLNEIDNSKIYNFIFKLREIFRKLNISIQLLVQSDILKNIEPRLYEKLDKLHIQENSLKEIYKYFITDNSIVFELIKTNIKSLSKDEKLNILIDKNEIENNDDEHELVTFSNLLAYHIGKSVDDETIEQRFVPKSSSGAMKKSLSDEVFDFLKYNIDSTKLLNEIAVNQVLTELKENFAYKTTKGFFIYFINNIVMENRLTADIIRKISNEVPIGSKIECNQFSYDIMKGNVLNVIAMDFQPTNILVEKLYKIASATGSIFSKRSSVEKALINILDRKELKIDSDGNFKVNISSNEILDSMGIPQSKEKRINRAKQTLKEFGLKPNKDGDYQ